MEGKAKAFFFFCGGGGGVFFFLGVCVYSKGVKIFGCIVKVSVFFGWEAASCWIHF